MRIPTSELCTPPEWEIDGDRGVIFGTAPADHGELSICQLLHDGEDADRCAADARLIINALPMLAALKRVKVVMDGVIAPMMRHPNDALAEVERVIAAVEGLA